MKNLIHSKISKLRWKVTLNCTDVLGKRDLNEILCNNDHVINR